MEDRQIGISEDTRRGIKKGIKGYKAFALTSVMSKWYATGVILRLELEREPETLKQQHVGGSDGIRCQHLHVMMADLLQKHLEWQEDRRKDVWHGSERRPTLHLAGIDNKTAFDVARPKHNANIIGGGKCARADCGRLVL